MSSEQKQSWLTEEQLGTVQTLRHRGRSIQYRVPKEIQKEITLRFKGYGKTTNGEPGDLLLLLRVDRGRDVEADLWLSQNQASQGCEKEFLSSAQIISVPVPCVSRHDDVVRVKQRGKRLPYQWGLPIFGRRRGDLRLRLRVFQDTVVPNYREANRLSTNDLAIEGWIYRHYDEALEKLGNRPHELAPFTALDAANRFNRSGWRGIADALIERFGLVFSSVKIKSATSLPAPGQCQTEVTTSATNTSYRHTILIRSDFLGDPFAVAAILAHELCHVVEIRKFGRATITQQLKGPDLLEVERTVDLLVFLHGLGEFQLRVARNSQLTLGYFNQELFDRMYVILSKKRDAYRKQ